MDKPDQTVSWDTAKFIFEKLDENNRLTDEVELWKSKFIQQNKDLGCEQMDPNGTIWDHAKKLQAENDRLKRELSDLEDMIQNLCTAVLTLRRRKT
jgi:hypothetical protein